MSTIPTPTPKPDIKAITGATTERAHYAANRLFPTPKDREEAWYAFRDLMCDLAELADDMGIDFVKQAEGAVSRAHARRTA